MNSERGATSRSSLERWWRAGVDAVRGEAAVRRALNALDEPPSASGGELPCSLDALAAGAFKPRHIIAVGKAAQDMAVGARAVLGPSVPLLVATKHGHLDERLTAGSSVQRFECGHPIPDANSLEAGQAMLEVVKGMPSDAQLLLLVSGGASAIAEVLKPRVSLDELVALNRQLMAGGEDIVAMNRRRLELSEIKAGGLLAAFGGRHVEVLGISDVPDARFETLGSGIGDCSRVDTRDGERSWCQRIIGSNEIARGAVKQAIENEGLTVIEDAECLYDDIERIAKQCYAKVENGPDGVYLWGGEPTVVLPEEPGEGGRNQALALLFARHIDGRADMTAIVAGTDGSDGPTEAAGAIVDGATWQRGDDPAGALERADAGSYLESIGERLHTGPTGTNVMDLMIVLKGDPASRC